MIIAIDTHGSALRREGKRFIVFNEDRTTEIAAKRVEQILISRSALVSSEAIRLAVEHDIDIVFLRPSGSPYARIWNCRFGSTAAIRRAQLEAANTTLGTCIVTNLIAAKLNNQAVHLRKLASRRSSQKISLIKDAQGIESVAREISKINGMLDAERPGIFGLEGTAGRIYFAAVGRTLPQGFRVERKTRRPAKDPFNCLLNYTYGMLSSIVEGRCIIAGLDPAVGYLHTDAPGRASLALDVMEPFRIYADTCVVSLIAARKIKLDMFDQEKDSFRLNAIGRKFTITEFRLWLSKAEIHDHRRFTRLDIISRECSKLASTLLAETAAGKAAALMEEKADDDLDSV